MWLLIRAKQTLSEHSAVDEWVWASASSFADQWSARVGRGVWPFLVILTAAQIWVDGCMWVNGWLEIAAVMNARRVFLLSSDWTLCLTAQHYIMDATTHRYITCINDKSGLLSRACGALVPKLQRYCLTAPSIGCYLHHQHHDTAENVAYCAILCVFPCPALCILIIVGISWLVYWKKQKQIKVRFLRLDHSVNSHKTSCVCIRACSVKDTLFLSSSAEYQKAESAPCCAAFSLKRAMSDNSNSTGSSGSSTNSWTLLSPEVSQRTRSGNSSPSSLRLDVI